MPAESDAGLTPGGGWSSAAARAAAHAPRGYPLAWVLDVHDGDTIKLDVDVGFGTHRWVWVRLRKVRCPELREPGGLLARQATLDWLAGHTAPGAALLGVGQWVSLITEQVAGEVREIREVMTFVRYVGEVFAGGASLNDHLLGLGYTDQGQ
jgi:hypothetical protein